MSYFKHDRNLEQILAPITILRGGTSRGFYFDGRNVPKPGKGLEEFLLAVRGSPDPMGMDGLGGNTILQSKIAIVSPSTRSDADVDYTFIQIFPDQVAEISYKLNCGNISAGVPVFALMKNMIGDVPDGELTIKAFSTNTGKMMYMTLEVLNGEAMVHGETQIGGIPGTGAEIMVDFRDQIGGFTGKLLPTGNLIDTIQMNDGSLVNVTIMDLVNICAFFDAEEFGCTGLELPNPDGSLRKPYGIEEKIAEFRLKVAKLIGWDQYDMDTIKKSALPFAVSITRSKSYSDMNAKKISLDDVDLVARFYAESIMHTAAPGSGSTTLGAAASIPGTIPNQELDESSLKSGNGGELTFGHPSGTFSIKSKPVLNNELNEVHFKHLSFARTARIICDGTVYIKNNTPPENWKDASEFTTASFFLESESIHIQK
ncbi:PrpF domain-containing protein [Methanobacterium alcaliphilum]|uniref:PrpF domain-containing protein n=1 Tax=Methanobacterium alcaliphilum TaxID=392018 RepID=UPI00200B1342|nr:PrpF domain-containing protein [Methanobacterium alcaliphilum]MCK9151361.1 hypothetical protein [Methanobacterium alcaliphilum]